MKNSIMIKIHTVFKLKIYLNNWQNQLERFIHITHLNIGSKYSLLKIEHLNGM
jgi:hypothetical protein